MDARFEVEEEMKDMSLKMANIEDRAHRNNIKFRGVPETVRPAELTAYLKKRMCPADIIIDRAQNLPSYLTRSPGM